MQVLSYTQTSIRVLGDNGKAYEYQGLSPFIISKVRTLIQHKAHGRAWALLKRTRR